MIIQKEQSLAREKKIEWGSSGDSVHCSNIDKQAARKEVEPKVPVTATEITYLLEAENYWGENLLGMDKA